MSYSRRNNNIENMLLKTSEYDNKKEKGVYYYEKGIDYWNYWTGWLLPC